MTLESPVLTTSSVPLRTGPPTKEEMLVYYLGKFTWNEMKTFVNSGDLGLLKRDKTLQKRYLEWSDSIKNQYGSIVNYLVNFRLQWGKPDSLCLLPSALDNKKVLAAAPRVPTSIDPSIPRQLPPLPADAPPYFTADTPSEYISIIMNDWPYSVPAEVEHSLIWTRVPIFHPDIIDERIAPRIAQDGIWGFTGNTSPPPSPSTLPACLPALSDWSVTLDKMVVSEKGTDEEEALVRRAGEEVHRFVKNRWVESGWETAWFVNPPRLQSVPGLAHIHVFAKQKH
ncbi:hypothetical protein BDZ89DRAFT_1075123 [Hymenopellis radicata]|nr:hypothetical protein BDZ89DRAFT_1075123 [Hymenopellis radicata]